VTNALCSPAVAALFREVDKPAPTFLAGDLPRRFRFAYLRGKRAAHGAGNPWNRPVSLSLLSRTMRDQADVVTHCQARLSKLWGLFPSHFQHL